MSNTTKKSKTLLQLHQIFTSLLYPKLFKIPAHTIQYRDAENHYYYINYAEKLKLYDYYRRDTYFFKSIVSTRFYYFFLKKASLMSLDVYIPFRTENIDWNSLQKNEKSIQNIHQSINYFYQKKLIKSNKINYFLKINDHLCNFLTLKKQFQTPDFFMICKKTFICLLRCNYRYNSLTRIFPASTMFRPRYQWL